MKYPWEIGDRVVCAVDHPSGNPDLVIGSTGAVCAITSCGVGVRWDYKIKNGHDCNVGHGENCELGYGWWIHETQIEPEFGSENDAPFEFDEDEFKKLVFGG